MRVRVDVDGTSAPRSEVSEGIRNRLRWVLGRYANEIRRVHVRVRAATPSGIECVVRVRMPDHELKVSESGTSEEEAIRLALARAGAAVARRSDLKRLLGT